MERKLSAHSSPDARPLVDAILADAIGRRASDVHVEPTAAGFEVRVRVDGLLETAATHDAAAGRGIVARLMVMAQLLTYRQDVPQEGRLTTRLPGQAADVPMRVSVMPTTHGLRAAVRLPAELVQQKTLADLDLPAGVTRALQGFAAADAGMLIVTGPAGSGKTTTLYALLGEIARTSPGLSIVALEDPVERDLPGVTQIEVSPFGQLTYDRALRSILRQDPQVLMLGEIRDAATAALALQATLSGHRLLCTFHAASPAGAIARLLEMGIEPHQVTSAVYGVVCQRLLRRRVDGGYRGRVPIAEFAAVDAAARVALLNGGDRDTLATVFAEQTGFIPMRNAAAELVGRAVTDMAEVGRVLGSAG